MLSYAVKGALMLSQRGAEDVCAPSARKPAIVRARGIMSSNGKMRFVRMLESLEYATSVSRD
jgi:hypothetical protein